MADIIGEVTTVALDFTKDLISDPFGTIEGVASGVFGDYYDQTKDNDLFQSKYDFTYRVFPSNLGEQSYNGHYMVININVQRGNRFEGSVTDDRGQKIRTFQTLKEQSGDRNGRSVGKGELSKTDALRFNIDKEWKDTLNHTFDTTSSFQIPRQTRRIVESIALYMPNTVVFDTTNDYEDVGLTSIGSGVASSAAQIASGFGGKIASKIINGAQGAADIVGTGAKLLQRPINPRIEVLFKNTLQRTFQFDFLFAPSNKDETFAMEQIIRTLRFHAAPEYSNSFGSFVYIPPSEFDITFFNRGFENRSIPRINTCALTKISVDYAPQGVYSVFRDTGSPVSCRMQVEFRELEVNSKLRILQGF